MLNVTGDFGAILNDVGEDVTVKRGTESVSLKAIFTNFEARRESIDRFDIRGQEAQVFLLKDDLGALGGLKFRDVVERASGETWEVLEAVEMAPGVLKARVKSHVRPVP